MNKTQAVPGGAHSLKTDSSPKYAEEGQGGWGEGGVDLQASLTQVLPNFTYSSSIVMNFTNSTSHLYCYLCNIFI